MLGETAMLDGAGRSATAIADASTRVRVLTQATLDDLLRSDADLAARLYRAIAIHLSQRLRAATARGDSGNGDIDEAAPAGDPEP